MNIIRKLFEERQTKIEKWSYHGESFLRWRHFTGVFNLRETSWLPVWLWIIKRIKLHPAIRRKLCQKYLGRGENYPKTTRGWSSKYDRIRERVWFVLLKLSWWNLAAGDISGASWWIFNSTWWYERIFCCLLVWLLTMFNSVLLHVTDDFTNAHTQTYKLAKYQLIVTANLKSCSCLKLVSAIKCIQGS